MSTIHRLGFDGLRSMVGSREGSGLTNFHTTQNKKKNFFCECNRSATRGICIGYPDRMSIEKVVLCKIMKDVWVEVIDGRLELRVGTVSYVWSVPARCSQKTSRRIMTYIL